MPTPDAYAAAITKAGATSLDPAAVESLAAMVRDIHLCCDGERLELARAGNTVPGSVRARAFQRLRSALRAARPTRPRKATTTNEERERVR